jgi:glycosyltransferase involved in cell wall biosynthesis
MSGSDVAWSSPSSPTIIEYTFSDRGQAVIADRIEIDTDRCWGAADVEAPLVSCLMITEDRPALAARAIECFLAQSYPNKELIVIDSSASDQLQHGIDAICYPPIKLHRMPGRRQPLGELRNIAVQQSAGEFVCQWDDDDLCDPDRLTVQMGAITAVSADACFLTRQQLWWATRHILAVSIRRIWEGTMVCAKDKMPLYPPLRKGEDTALAFHVWRTVRVVMLDEPRLYTYVFHGANTFDEAHFAQHFAVTTQQSTGDAYAEWLSRLRTRVPIDTDDAASPQSADRNGDNRQNAPAAAMFDDDRSASGALTALSYPD